MELKELLSQLPTEQERKDLLVQALNAAIPYLQKEDQNQKVIELEKANQELNARLEKAKEYFAENKGAVQQAEKRAAAGMARNLQKTRDELYVIGNTLHDYALALGEKSTAKLTLVQVNNLLGFVQEIIQNLRENGLWNDETDVMPELNTVEKAKKPRTTKKKKAEEAQESSNEPPQNQRPDQNS